MNDQKYLKQHNIEKTYEEVVEISKYLKKQNCDISIYKDYLILSQKLNRELNEHSVKFPSRLMEQHDCLVDLVNVEKNKELNKKLSRKYKKFIKYVCELDNLKIVVPATVNDFIKWGKTLHNCVGSLGYDEKMANGNCIILGVFKNNKIVECCELNKKHEIVQLRGLNNGESKYHSKAKELVNMFVSNMNLQMAN